MMLWYKTNVQDIGEREVESGGIDGQWGGLGGVGGDESQGRKDRG